MAEPIDLNEFMNRFSEVMDYAFRRLVHSRPEQRAPEVASGFAQPPAAASVEEGEIPPDLEVPPDLFDAFGIDEQRRLAQRAANSKQEELDIEDGDSLLRAHEDYTESQRRINRAMMRFMEQAAVDNHRDSQMIEHVVESFIESRDEVVD
jgi:hypothetical protein